MHDQLTAIVDLLGFSSISDERESQILSLLTTLVGAKSETSLETNYIGSSNRVGCEAGRSTAAFGGYPPDDRACPQSSATEGNPDAAG
jgi:hypothetical protein